MWRCAVLTQYGSVPDLPASGPRDRAAAGSVPGRRRRHGHPAGADAHRPAHRYTAQDSYPQGTCHSLNSLSLK